MPLTLVLLVIYVSASIRYKIASNELLITIGSIYKKKIEISSILKVTATDKTIASPAASLERLEFFFGNC